MQKTLNRQKNTEAGYSSRQEQLELTVMAEKLKNWHQPTAGSSLNTGRGWGKELQVWWVEQVIQSAQTSPAVTEESSECLKEKAKTTPSAPPAGRLAKLQQLVTEIDVRVQWSPGVVGSTFNLKWIDSSNIFHPWPPLQTVLVAWQESVLCHTVWHLSVCLHVNRATGQLIGFLGKFHKLLDLALLLLLPTVMGF